MLKGPGGSTLVFGAEFAQQPRFIEGLPGPTVPTAVTFIARVVPLPERLPLIIDFGVLQAVGNVAPGVDLRARNRFATGVSYHF